jgi:hypothetical protein
VNGEDFGLIAGLFFDGDSGHGRRGGLRVRHRQQDTVWKPVLSNISAMDDSASSESAKRLP